MKKAFVITSLMCLLVATTGWAQESSVGIKGGFNLSSLTTDGNDDSNLNLGINVGVFNKIALTKSVAIQPELLYSMKGTRINYDESSFAEGDSKFNLHYIDLPVKLVFNLSEDFEFQVGPYVGYLIGANTETDATVMDAFNIDSENELDRENFNTIDYGITAGLGFDLNPLIIGANYSLGLNQVAKKDKAPEEILDNAKNSVIQVYVGIKF